MQSDTHDIFTFTQFPLTFTITIFQKKLKKQKVFKFSRTIPILLQRRLHGHTNIFIRRKGKSARTTNPSMSILIKVQRDKLTTEMIKKKDTMSLWEFKDRRSAPPNDIVCL